MSAVVSKTEPEEEVIIPPYVITGADEGVQVNFGTRLGFAGCGYELEGFSKAVKILKELLGKDIRIASSAENDWMKDKMQLSDWDQTNASMQQQTEAIADKEGLMYAGFLPFADPRKLKHDIKGHMVRPHDVHIGNKICFSLGGGEQVYNLGCYRISADWVGKAHKKVVEKMILPQIEFFTKVAGLKKLELFYETEGIIFDTNEKLVKKNLKKLQSLGLKMEELPKRGLPKKIAKKADDKKSTAKK